MSWAQGTWLGFDSETTSPEPDWARLLTFALVWITPPPPGSPAGTRVRTEVLTRMADPVVPIPAGAAAVHGITTERARAEGFPARDVVYEVLTHLRTANATGIPVVSHNSVFDLTVIDREARRHGFPPLERPAPLLDSLVWDRALVQRPGKRRLTDCAEFHGVPLRAEDAHDATADTLASLRIMWRLVQRFPDLADTPLDQLHDMQIELAARQAADLQKRLQRWKGPDFRIDPTWPVQPLPAGWDPTYHPNDDESETS